MPKYILKRILRSFLTMAIVITVVFSLLRLMPIEGYFENYDKLSQTQIDLGLQKLGLTDKVNVNGQKVGHRPLPGPAPWHSHEPQHPDQMEDRR